MTKQFKQIVKKIYKTGFFVEINTEPRYIGFKNVHGALFTFQLDPEGDSPTKNTGYFTAGYVRQWVDRGLTYESEYTAVGNIPRAKYEPFYIQQTDNPDFILRMSKQITLNQI